MSQDLEFPDFIRASGECICMVCGKNYYSHPSHSEFKWLKVLCDGKLVKL